MAMQGYLPAVLCAFRGTNAMTHLSGILTA